MITTTLRGALVDFIERTDLVTKPYGPEGQAFLDFWNHRVIRNCNLGYFATLSAPAWVFNWIMDYADTLLVHGATATRLQTKGARQLRTFMLTEGIRRVDADGPTANDLRNAGYLPTP